MKKILWVIVFVLLVSNIYGLGIAPAKTTFDFEPNTVKEGYFRIITDDVPTKVVFTKEKELGKYIELENDVMILEQKETWINFKLNMPEDLPPGERNAGILVLQIPKDTGQENVVMAATAIVHLVKVNVPFPGKYVTGKLFITNTKVNDPILFTVALVNWGKENVKSAKATIVIKGPTNEEVAVMHTDSVSINSNQEVKLLTTWQTENPGTYFAEAVVEYDGQIYKISQSFNVGSLDLEIERIIVDNFKIGQIAKLDIYLRNKWNKPLNIEGRVEIFKDNDLISSFNTIPVNVLERSTGIMNAYWNTEGVDVGEYDISVKAQYDGKTSEKTFTSVVSIDHIKFKDFAAGKVISGGEGSNTTILVVAVLILIILNVMLFVYIRKKLQSKTPPSPPIDV